MLFREVIRKKIFPSLTKDQAYRLINRFILLTTIVALAGIGAWVVTELSQSEAAPAVQQGSLRLVEVSFNEEVDQFPQVDVRLRDTGEVAFLKRAVFHVDNVWRFESVYCPSAEPASWNYDVELPVKGAPYTRDFDISQSVQPD